MDKKVNRKNILAFLKASKCAVLSTVNNDGRPECAEVYFGVDNKFNIYIPTGSLTRKYKNLKNSKYVAFVVGDPKKQITLQIEGKISEMERLKKGSKALKALLEVLTPTTKEILSHLWDPIPPVLKMQNGDLVILKITPNWIRWADFSLTAKQAKGNYFTEITP